VKKNTGGGRRGGMGQEERHIIEKGKGDHEAWGERARKKRTEKKLG